MDTSVEVMLSLAEATMTSLALGSGDFSPFGIASINLEGTSNCIPITFFMHVDTSANPGEVLSIPVAVGIPPGFCSQSDSAYSTIHLLIVDCARSECLCPDESENINLNGGHILLSRAVTGGVFGDPNNPQSPPCLSVNGLLIVDVPFFQISNCEIILGPNAKIRVLPNSTFHLNENHIHGCEYLWNFISKEGAGMLLVHNNLIEDGIWALEFNNNTSTGIPVASISNNKFNKNFVGISTPLSPPNSSFHKDVDFVVFSSNEFTCEGVQLLPKFGSTMIYPPIGSVTFAGLYFPTTISAMTLNGTPSTPPNYFHHIQNGIISDLSDLYISNAKFAHIPVNSEYSTNNHIGAGYGIWINGNLIQEGSGFNTSVPDFQSVHTGIYVWQSYGLVYATLNYMNEVKTGIKITRSPATYLNNNIIRCDNYGIDFANDGMEYLQIRGNTISVDHPSFDGFDSKGTGININASELTELKGKIVSNTISLYNRNIGININLTNGGEVRENTVIMYGTDALAGIRLAGSRNTDISCNTVSGIASTFDPGKNIGINVNNSRGCTYSCNNIGVTSVGLQFMGLCNASSSPLMQTNVRGNSFYRHGYGLLMQPDALFGAFNNPNVQAHKGNTWSGNFLEDKAVHLGEPDHVYYSRFLVHSGNLPYYPYSDDTANPDAPMPPLPNAQGGVWFEVVSGNPDTCSQECSPILHVDDEPDSIRTLGIALLKDSLAFTAEFGDAIKETLRRQLYRILDDYPALTAQDTALLNFYTNGSTGTLGTLTAIDRLKEAVGTIDSTANAQILLWQGAIQQRLDSISIAEGQLSSEPDSATLAGFEQMRNDYFLEIDSFTQLSKAFFCSLSVARVALIDSAFVLNAGIVPVTDMEDNEFETNKMYLRKAYFGNYAFTPTETDILFSIAGQCPTLGGDAVFKARGMLAAAGWELNINDDSLCYTTASRPVLHTVKAAKSSKSFIVYPNPAKDRIFIKMPDLEIGKIEIRILDILGNTMFQQYMLTDTGLYEIPISILPLGAFFIQVFQDCEIIGAKKFFKIP